MKRNEDSEIILKQLYARQDSVFYTYKTHEKAADRYHRFENWRRIVSLLLTALATGSFLLALTNFFSNSPETGNLITAAIAVIASGVSYAADYFRFEEKKKDHVQTAVQLRRIYLEYESLIVDLEAELLDITEVAAKRDLIIERESRLLEIAPRTTSKDFAIADKAINTSEKPYSLPGEIEHRKLISKAKDITDE